jgi:transposase-like protein
MWLVVNCKNGVSSYEIARDLKVTQKTAWFMDHRIRLAMQSGSFEKTSGEFEVDESFIGGSARFMHKDKKAKITGTGGAGKAVVMGLLDRKTKKIRLRHVADTSGPTLQGFVREHVQGGSYIFSDAWRSYNGLSADYVHQVIDHAEKYVDGEVHTNGIENFWSLLKRGLKGTYINVEPFHLFRYLDEQAFRFNNRKVSDGVRFVEALSSVVGKRLTFRN